MHNATMVHSERGTHEIDRRAGCTTTLTFDQRLVATEGFEEPGAETGYPTRVSEP